MRPNAEHQPPRDVHPPNPTVSKSPVTGRKRGRPSKADKEARAQAAATTPLPKHPSIVVDVLKGLPEAPKVYPPPGLPSINEALGELKPSDGKQSGNTSADASYLGDLNPIIWYPPSPPAYGPSSGWGPSQDRALIAAQDAGQDWTQIQAGLFPDKTSDDCRDRHQRLMTRARPYSAVGMERILPKRIHAPGLEDRPPPVHECLWKSEGCPYKSSRESNLKQHMEKAHGWNYDRTETDYEKGTSAWGSAPHDTPELAKISSTLGHDNI
ncbi:hypothetical protein GE09DRAFT_320449 [Coniochaeta sp. 2T2.1]|nr:hypothetical protein GE09DRAFT_320449 [Coniochaeta sp. 2T2.1]